MAAPFPLEKGSGHSSIQNFLLPKTGNTNQIALFVVYDVCVGITMGTMQLCNEYKNGIM